MVIRSASNITPLTESGYQTILWQQERLKKRETSVDQIYDEIREKLAFHLELSQGTGIFFAPSEVSA